MKWFKIRSWHAYELTSRIGTPKAYCGKWGLPNAQLVEDLPAGKSCESCLRIVARLKDQ